MLSLDTGSYQGRLVKKMPFVVDNPEHGQAVKELPATAELRKQQPQAFVVELFHDAPAAELGLERYDGVRDVYFGPEAGGCTALGTDLSYGDDLRYQLHLGGSDRRTLIKYDLAMLPAQTKLTKAVLALYVLEVDKAADLSCRLWAMKKPWSEALVSDAGGLPVPPYTRGRPYPIGEPINWDEPLAKGKADRHDESVAELKFDKPGWVYVDITAAAEKWLSGQWANHGLTLELPDHKIVAGKRDVLIRSSDYNGEPAERPRLLLALAEKPKPVGYQVQQTQTDLASALEQARERRKLVLLNVLSAGSLTSRTFETSALGEPEVSAYLQKNFIEVRIDAAQHKELLRKYGVRRFPSTIAIAAGKDGSETYRLLEPYDWACDDGELRSSFEFPQTYTRLLQQPLDAFKHSGKLAAAERAGCP